MVLNTFTEPIRKKSNRGYENRNRTEPWKSWTVPALLKSKTFMQIPWRAIIWGVVRQSIRCLYCWFPTQMTVRPTCMFHKKSQNFFTAHIPLRFGRQIYHVHLWQSVKRHDCGRIEERSVVMWWLSSWPLVHWGFGVRVQVSPLWYNFRDFQVAIWL